MEEKRLLIVDDENGILSVYSDFFKKRGFYVDTASNGIDGYEKLKSGGYLVAIVDISMPKMDGITLLRKVNADDIATNVIILTGHGEKSDAIAAINAGASGWFEKNDIRMSDLLEKVNTMMEDLSMDNIAKILSRITEDCE